MYRMVQIALVYGGPFRDPKALEPVMTSLGLDWVRYSHFGWLLWTNRPIYEITERLKAVLQADDQFFVSALNPHEQTGGRLTQWIWDWINLKRDPLTGMPQQPTNAPRPMTGFGFSAPGKGLDSADPWWAALYGNHEPEKKG